MTAAHDAAVGARAGSKTGERDFIRGLQVPRVTVPRGHPRHGQQHVRRRRAIRAEPRDLARFGNEMMGDMIGAARVIRARIANAAQDVKTPAANRNDRDARR